MQKYLYNIVRALLNLILCFRWKGENVATTEVTETLGLVEFIHEVNVYGVEIKGMSDMRLCLHVCYPNIADIDL